MKYHRLILSLAVLLLSWMGQTVKSQQILQHDEYLHHSYQEAIRKYKNQVAQHPDDGKLLFNLADSYRLNGELKQAEIWFAQAILHSDDSRAQLYYAQILLSNRKYADAEKAFLNYAGQAESEADVANARHIAASCHKLNLEGPQQNAIHVQKADFNSDKLDFSPVFWKPGYLVFASNRPGTTGPSDELDPWTEEAFVDLWMVDVAANGKTGTPQLFSKALNSRYHEGPMAFDQAGTTIYFTRSDLQGNTRRGYDDKNNTRLKIYTANWIDADWVIQAELPFNSSDFSTCHPALSASGDTLVFSSDRPGGFGGMDLWYVVREGKGWSAPANLGQAINTAGNEVFPTLHGSGSLYYSSDFMAGYGGLDIFAAASNPEGWAAPVNMGAPINSSLDDYGIAVSADKKHGHFSSTRSGSSDDIYSFLDMADITIPVLLVDCKTGRALLGAQLMVTGPERRVLQADSAGRVHVPAIAGMDYALRAYGEGYYATDDCAGNASVHVPSKGNELMPEITLRLTAQNPCCRTLVDPDHEGSSNLHYQWKTGDGLTESGRNIDHCYASDGQYTASLEMVDPDFASNIIKYKTTVTIQGCNAQTALPLVVNGVIRDKQLGTPLPFATLDLVNQCTGKTITVTTDSSGAYQFVLPGQQDCDFWLIGKKDGYATQNILLPIKGRSNASPLRQDAALDPAGSMAMGGAPGALPGYPQQLPTLPAGYIYVMPINMQAALQPGTMQTEASFSKPLAQGEVIELYNIYFDLDKYTIRYDAETDLQFLLMLMRKYPNMHGEIIAHTDSRSSASYNAQLSANRARAAKAWLVARGVDPMRLFASGMGESQLRNQCVDGVYCTELEHQRNRRVEFRVTHFDGVISSKEYECFLPNTMSAFRSNR